MMTIIRILLLGFTDAAFSFLSPHSLSEAVPRFSSKPTFFSLHILPRQLHPCSWFSLLPIRILPDLLSPVLFSFLNFGLVFLQVG